MIATAALLLFVYRNARSEQDAAGSYLLGSRVAGQAAALRKVRQLQDVMTLVDACAAADVDGTLIDGSPLLDDLRTVAVEHYSDRPGYLKEWSR